MALVNTSSPLGNLFDRLTQQFDQRAQNEQQLRGLAAGGIIPASTAPQQSWLSKLINGDDTTAPAAATVAPGAPVAPSVASSAPVTPAPVIPVTAVPLAYTQQAQPSLQQQPSAASVSSSGTQGLPSIAAIQGQSPSSGIGGMFSGLEQKFNLPQGYLAQTANIESNGNPNAVSPTGAKGLFQFTKGTAQQYGLTDPTNVVASSFAAAKLASDNAASLTNALGRPPTAAELYLAHQQGAGGAAALLSNPNARAGDVVGDKAVRVNGGDPNMSAGQFASLWTSKFGSGVAGGGAVQPVAQASSPYGALDQNAFSSAAPSLAANPQVASLSPATPFPNSSSSSPTRSPVNQPVRTDAQGNALNPDGTPTSMNYSVATGSVTAPATQAINSATQGQAQPYGSVPVMIKGQLWTRQQAEDAPEKFDIDGTDYDKAAAAQGGVPTPSAPPSTAPGVAVAGHIAAPSLQTPNPGAAASTAGVAQAPTLQQIQALIFNPATRSQGLQMWQSYLTPKDGYTLSEGQKRFNAQNELVAGVPDKPITVSAGSSIVDPQHPGTALYTAPSEDKSTDKGFAIVQTGQDQYGNKQFGTLNKSTGSITPIQGGTVSGASTSQAGVGNLDLHGQDFLATLDPQIAGQVKAIVEGRAPYPTGMLLKTPYGQQLASYVTQADPTFESGNANNRIRVRGEFSAGGPSSPAGMITAGNTAIQHLGHLSDSAEALNNGTLPIKNWVGNELAQQTGGGVAVNQFNNILGKYVEEATKFYRGSGGTEADIQRDLGNLNSNMSPNQLHTAIQTQVELLQSKINALQDRWRQGMGPLVSDFSIIQPDSQQALDRIAKRAGVAPTNSPNSAQNPAGAGVGAMAQNAQPPAAGRLSPEDALKLPPGTTFMSLDGRLLVRH